MGYLDAFFMGLVQGLTEFLPVSSSGHLSLLEHIFKFSNENLVFEVGVHIGTVLSILVVYRKTIYQWIAGILKFFNGFQINDGAYLFALVVVSALPVGFIGILFKDFISQAFSSLLVVGICFLVTGVLLYWTEKKSASKENKGLSGLADLSDAREITFKQALIIGLAQSVAILPGISRSGSTIAVALSLGIKRSTAAMFSFLMSVPVILGAGLLQLRDVSDLNYLELKLLAFSVLISFIFGLVGLLMILYFVKKAKLSGFSWYLWTLGLGTITLHFIGA